MLQIFDGANVRNDLDTLAAEIEALDDDKREKLFGCVKANADKCTAEANLASARAAVRDLQIVYHNAQAEFQKWNPPPSHQQLLADAIAAQNGRPKPSSGVNVRKLADKVAALEKKARANRDKPEIEAELVAARKEHAIAAQPMKAKAALDDAHNALAVAQANVTKAYRALKDAEPVNNAAIADWLACNADRVTHLDLVRQAATRDAERALAAKAAEPKPTGPKVWPYEQHLKSKNALRKPRTYFGPL